MYWPLAEVREQERPVVTRVAAPPVQRPVLAQLV
jgi:hypothetical protein